MARWSALAAAAALAALALSGPAQAERTLERLSDFDLPGGDYRTLRSVPVEACESACLADTACAGFTYNERARWCFLKSSVGDPVPYGDALSAIVRETAPTPAAERLPLPALAFLPEDLPLEAARLEAQVTAVNRRAAPVGILNPAAAEALAAGGTAAWLDFARRMLDQRWEQYGDERAAILAAGAAGYLGLRDATTPQEQGRALGVISRAMERQGLTRPAIEASAASLTFLLDADEEARLAQLRADYGFRVLDYAVDAETREPRLCVQFSEPLGGDAGSLSRFVAVEGMPDPVVSAEGSQLCIEGLAHGGRYEATVRAGLPSTLPGETLQANAELRVYVRDRAPSVRFEANRYVLPKGAGGLPVTAVNTDEVALALYRINDRSLAEVVRRGDFKRQLYAYELYDLAEERGALVWEGAMPVETVRNQEVSTLFPVDEAVATVEPGVYVLTAEPKESADQDSTVATQWFVVSDLGLATFTAGDTTHAFVRSLETAEPRAGVEVQLLARNDEVLATAVTDADGHARLVTAAPMTGGETPALVTARAADDYAFLSLLGAAFELTDRGDDGRTAPGPVDAFLATERGIYRAGETVHLTALLRDDGADALAVPVTLKLTRPDGVLSRRIAETPRAAGGLALDLPLAPNAVTGTWTLTAHVDPEGPAVGTTTFLVEDFVPQRIEVDLATEATEAVAGETVAATVQADFLYGAPAADLLVEGSLTLRPAAEVAGFEGYRFGLDAEPFTPQRVPLFDLPRTDATGAAALTIPVPAATDANGALEARVLVRVREPGGRTVEDALTLPVVTGNPVIGIRPAFEGSVGEGEDARFALVALDGDRQPEAITAEWTLSRITQDWQWYRRNNTWLYESVERIEEVAAGTVEIGTDGPAALAIPTTGWGDYRLEVLNAEDAATASSVTFSAGWASAGATAETPDILEVRLDKETYAAGDTARLTILPREPGKALVTVLSGTLLTHRLVDIPAEGAEVDIPVEADWAPGAYVAATLVRPAASGEGRPVPTRAVGLAYLDVDTSHRRLALTLDAPETITPRQTLTVPVRVEGLDPGETAALTVAAVDVGILNITGYTAPDVDGHYLGQRRLGVELRDLYGELIDPAGATRGQPRSGGDGPASGADALPPNEKPVSLFTGLIETGPDGVATATFDVPAFNGTLRLMAIAWTETKVGDAEREVIVRDPVVVASSLPRFLAPGDETRMRVDVHNVGHAPGEYRLSVTADGPVDLGLGEETFTLARDERTSVELPLLATGVGTAALAVRLDGPDGLSLHSDLTLAVRPPAAEVAQRRLVALAPGEATALDDTLLAGFDEGATVTLSVGTGEVDTVGLLQMLDRFPYGCAEQTVSRALPLLYLNEVAASVGLEGDAAIAPRIEAAVARVLSYQSSSGGFGLWSPGTDLWLTAYVLDFLTRAREAGFTVPDDAMVAGLDRLQSMLSYIGDVSGDRGSEIAYATYVLARNGRAAIGDLRYFAEEKLPEFATSLARGQLAASLALAGDPALAARLFAAESRATTDPTLYRLDYGTDLRDAAAVLTLAAESGAGPATVESLSAAVGRLKADRGNGGYSTQEAAWLLMSAAATTPATGAVTVDGTPLEAPLFRTLSADELTAGVAVANEATRPLAVATTVRGTPLEPLPPTGDGLTLERSFHDLDGNLVDPSEVAQNERLIVRLTFTKTAADPMRLMLTDLLPAGFEVENPRLVDTAEVAALPGAQEGQMPEHIEFRDDRFAAAWTFGEGTVTMPTTVSYMVRAVSPGTFVLPAAELADMYQPRFVARTAAGSVAVVPTR